MPVYRVLCTVNVIVKRYELLTEKVLYKRKLLFL